MALIMRAGSAGLKMKDWDKIIESQEADNGEVSGSDSDGAVDW